MKKIIFLFVVFSFLACSKEEVREFIEEEDLLEEGSRAIHGNWQMYVFKLRQYGGRGVLPLGGKRVTPLNIKALLDVLEQANGYFGSYKTSMAVGKQNWDYSCNFCLILHGDNVSVNNMNLSYSQIEYFLQYFNSLLVNYEKFATYEISSNFDLYKGSGYYLSMTPSIYYCIDSELPTPDFYYGRYMYKSMYNANYTTYEPEYQYNQDYSERYNDILTSHYNNPQMNQTNSEYNLPEIMKFLKIKKGESFTQDYFTSQYKSLYGVDITNHYTTYTNLYDFVSRYFDCTQLQLTGSLESLMMYDRPIIAEVEHEFSTKSFCLVVGYNKSDSTCTILDPYYNYKICRVPFSAIHNGVGVVIN